MAAAGITGVTVQGSTGEAATLSKEERIQVNPCRWLPPFDGTLTIAHMQMVRTTREALDEVNPSAIIIVGTCGAQSTAQAIEFATDGAHAGAEYALVLPPAYYASTLQPADVVAFFNEVADACPIPVLLYSYPGVTSGLVITSDTIAQVGKHPNVVGYKGTDHDIGRASRLASLRESLAPFSVLGGASDYLVPSLSIGASGCITGMCNIAPRLVMQVYNLWRSGKHDEAMKLQGVLSRGEWPLGKGQINGVKYAVAYWNNLPESAAACRRPVPEAPEAVKQYMRDECKEAIDFERRSEEEAGAAGPGCKKVANGH